MRVAIIGTGLAIALAAAPVAFAQQYHQSNGSAKGIYHESNGSAATPYHQSNGSAVAGNYHESNGSAKTPYHESNGSSKKKGNVSD